MHLKPLFNNVGNIRKQSNLVSDFLFEGSNVLHGVHLVKSSEIGFKFLLKIHNVATECARGINTLPGLNLELGNFPRGSDFVTKLFL